MQTKDITDHQVVQACASVQETRHMSSMDALIESTGAPAKVALRAMERACGRGLINWGVSIRWAWPTPEGIRESLQSIMNRRNPPSP